MGEEGAAMTKEVNQALAWEPPNMDAVWDQLAPMRRWFDPQFVGLEHADPNRPALYVANHTLFGVVDAPLFMAGLAKHRGVFLRGLADRIHYEIPLWRDLLGQSGAVLGDPDMCRAMMDAGQSILVFPGGGREVVKRKGEAYKLIWKERYGFVRLILEKGYPIIPVSAVGAEEMYDIVLDANDIMNSPLGRALEQSGITEKYLRGGEMIAPMVRGLFGTMVPRPQQFWFKLGAPMDFSNYAAMREDPKTLQIIRNAVGEAIEDGIAELKEKQAEAATEAPLWRRLLNRF